MSEPIRIVVKVDPSRTSLNQRLHWRARKQRNDYAKEAARLAYAVAGRPTASGPVRVSVVVRRGRVIDRDNARSGLKAVFDSLFCAKRNGEGITPDDGPQWVHEGPLTFECGAVWRGREEVELLIEEMPR